MFNEIPENWLAAHLSADLPFDLSETIENIPSEGGSGKEEWAEALSQGIEKATFISEERVEELLGNPSIIRFHRCIEALSTRRELNEAQTFKLIWLCLYPNPDGKYIVVNPTALYNIWKQSPIDFDLVHPGDDGEYKKKVEDATGISGRARMTAKLLFEKNKE